jgi:8-oxo-dGTP diphosphatase
VICRVAGVLLIRDGRVLLQHRDDRPDILYPGAWAIFGGHVEPGETAEQGARREIEEELGLRLPEGLALVCERRDADRERTFFAAELTVPPEALELREGQGMRLFSLEELERFPVVPAHVEVIRGFFCGRLEQ